MQKAFTVAAVLVLAGSVACGKSEAEKQAEQATAEAAKAAEAAAKVAEAAGADMAKGVEGFAKAMEGMASAMAGGKAVEPVPFQVLETVLPKVDGWQMAEPESERVTAPIAYSETEAIYSKGDARVEVKVVDSGFASMLIAPWSMMLATGYSKESRDGYEKAVNVGGQPGFEKWEKAEKDGELNLLVNKRYLVTVEGNDLEDTKLLHEFVAKMDLSKLPSPPAAKP